MPSGTKEQRKREAVWSVVFFGLLQLVCAAVLVALCFIPGLPIWVVALLGVLAAGCIISLLLALAALRQRFQEIEGGELDAAAEY